MLNEVCVAVLWIYITIIAFWLHSLDKKYNDEMRIIRERIAAQARLLRYILRMPEHEETAREEKDLIDEILGEE